MSPKPSSRPSWASSDDHLLLGVGVILVGLAFYAWLAWTNHHAEIAAGFVRAAHWHIRALLWLSDDGWPARVMRRLVPDPGALRGFAAYYADLDRRMLAADPALMTPGKLWEVAGAVCAPFRWPAAGLLAGLAALCFVRAAPARFTRELDLDGLAAEHARTYRSTAAFVRRKLGVVAPRAGEPRPADPSLHPQEWVEHYATGKDGRYDDSAARAELGHQLGPVWQGVGQAAPHVRILYAAFALHLAGRLADALDLLGDASESLAEPVSGEGPGGPEHPLALPPGVAAAADEVLRDPDIAGPARAIAVRHGYTAPALMGLLNEARRRGGVFQPALFAWLRLVDRRLWYALHSLGFPADRLAHDLHPNPLVEAVGARDHWAAENAAGGPLLVPSIERAALCVRAAAGDAAPASEAQEPP